MKKLSNLLEKIKELQGLGVGDSVRLEHLRNSVVENRKIYNSDLQYVHYLDDTTKRDTTKTVPRKENFCWKCDKDLLPQSKYCSFCGIDQSQQESDYDVVTRKNREINPIKIILNIHSYQLLAVLGGLASLVPTLIAIVNLERIFELVQFYFGLNLSGYDAVLVGLGSVSIAISGLLMAIPFLIKKPKQVGKILFFSSFSVLVLSVITGVAGFAILLTAGILALKQRRY